MGTWSVSFVGIIIFYQAVVMAAIEIYKRDNVIAGGDFAPPYAKTMYMATMLVAFFIGGIHAFRGLQWEKVIYEFPKKYME